MSRSWGRSPMIGVGKNVAIVRVGSVRAAGSTCGLLRGLLLGGRPVGGGQLFAGDQPLADHHAAPKRGGKCPKTEQPCAETSAASAGGLPSPH
jgi:hypothetical protein